LVRGPKLLILDEATSALDQETQSSICATLQKLTGRLTVLAISHRQALVDVADQAYRLDLGSLTLVKGCDEIERKLEERKTGTSGPRKVIEAFRSRA
jgi:ATP-binding cassette subfamily C protein